MAEAARYLFDRAFDAPARGSESEEAVAVRKLQEEWERKMAEACCTAYEEGRAEGEAAALKSLEQEARATTGELLQGAQSLLGQVERECTDIRRNAIEIATAAATLLAEELIARAPALNLESLFAEALEHMGDAPHIALTVNDALAERVRELVHAVAAERGFTGKIVVLGDPETRKGDCALQWADGGITRDFEKAKARISAIVRRHLDRQTANGTGTPVPGKTAAATKANGAGTNGAAAHGQPANGTGTNGADQAVHRTPRQTQQVSEPGTATGPAESAGAGEPT